MATSDPHPGPRRKVHHLRGHYPALATALWTAFAAAHALIRGLNLAYGERECRGAWRLAASSLAVALCGALFALLALATFLALPSAAGDGASEPPVVGSEELPQHEKGKKLRLCVTAPREAAPILR